MEAARAISFQIRVRRLKMTRTWKLQNGSFVGQGSTIALISVKTRRKYCQLKGHAENKAPLASLLNFSKPPHQERQRHRWAGSGFRHSAGSYRFLKAPEVVDVWTSAGRAHNAQLIDVQFIGFIMKPAFKQQT